MFTKTCIQNPTCFNKNWDDHTIVNPNAFPESKIAKVVGIYIDYDRTQRSEDRDAISRSDRSIGKVDLHIKSNVWN